MKAPDRLGRILAAVLLVVAAGSTALAAEPTKTVRVDCAKGETIAKVLTRDHERKPLIVLVTGICNESVIVNRSDVTLQGDPVAGGGVAGPDPAVDTIVVTGNRVLIEQLTITGGRGGIVGNGAAGLTVRNAVVQATGRTGIVYASGASGLVDGCTVQLNPRNGVTVQDAAHATIVNSTITQNSRAGVFVGNGASARIGIDGQGLLPATRSAGTARTGLTWRSAWPSSP